MQSQDWNADHRAGRQLEHALGQDDPPRGYLNKYDVANGMVREGQGHCSLRLDRQETRFRELKEKTNVVYPGATEMQPILFLGDPMSLASGLDDIAVITLTRQGIDGCRFESSCRLKSRCISLRNTMPSLSSPGSFSPPYLPLVTRSGRHEALCL